MLLGWILLGAAATLVVAELAVNGLVFAPIAVGTFAGALASFAGAGAPLTLAVVLALTAVSFVALRPLASRLNAAVDDTGIGARRLEHARGVCESDVGPSGGLVRVERELWQAEPAADALPAGTRVRVLHVRGTRLVVTADESLSDNEEVLR